MIPRESVGGYATGRVFVALVAVVAVSALALGVVLTTATFHTAVADDDVTLGCVAGADDGAAYVTDSSLTVYENADSVTYGSFVDESTVEFQGNEIVFSANSTGSAEVRLDAATGIPCLANLTATGTDVGVDPDNASSITVGQGGEFDALAFRDVFYDPDDTATDLAYDATSFGSLVLHGTGLANGTEVEAVDASGGATLGTATIENDAAEFDSLPEGEFEVDFRMDTGVAGDGSAGDCPERRDISRGQVGEDCPSDRDISRGEGRGGVDNGARDSDERRRDRGRRDRDR